MPFQYAPTTTTTSNIQSNSPYKVFFPSTEYGAYTDGLKKATLNVWIYVGAQGNANTTSSGDNIDASIAGASGGRSNAPSKVLKSTAVGNIGEEFVSFDIANIIKSQLKQEFTGEDVESTATVNPNITIWVDYQLTTEINNRTKIQPLFQFLAFDGYTYFEEGVNAQTPYGALVSAGTLSVVEGEELYIPILLGGDATTVTYYNADGTVCNTDSYPVVPTLSYNQIKYSSCTDAASVTIESGLPAARVININTLSCNKHTPYKLSFLNRFGAIESLWFNGNNTESSSSKTKEYGRVITSSVNGSEYSNSRSSRYKQRLSSTKSMSLNSGFYPEECNVTFEELVDSSEVWIHKDGVVLPVNIKTSTFNKKTELNDNAINYTINIEFAFNKINNI
tara:strand:- start:9127 stop:10305 length:1179 start_codon:yes stop_codon:yes gene_type:complete